MSKTLQRMARAPHKLRYTGVVFGTEPKTLFSVSSFILRGSSWNPLQERSSHETNESYALVDHPLAFEGGASEHCAFERGAKTWA